MFDGKLGRYPHEKFHLELVEGAKPVFKRAYSVPYKHETVFKKELDSLVADGVLEQCGRSSWAFPTFIIPKSDQTVRWVSDFRDLNTLLLRKPFPMPKIHDVMNRRGKYKYFTKIDLSMMFYCFELDDESKELCTINTPYGLYRYRRLPMGVKVSPDIAQQYITQILHDVLRGDEGHDVVVYIDDCVGFGQLEIMTIISI